MRVILGSASPRRTEILDQAGIEHEVVASGCEETVTKTIPSEVVSELAEIKAEDVWSRVTHRENAALLPDEEILVLAADTIVAVDDVIYGKPADRQDAIRMLKNLSGRTHRVYTGVAVIARDKKLSFVSGTDVSVYDLDDKEIEEYADSGEPMDKAGAYAIQGRFAKYIREIKGEYNNVVGLPIARILYELKKAGIQTEGN